MPGHCCQSPLHWRAPQPAGRSLLGACRSERKDTHLDAGVAERRQARPLVALDVILQQQPRALPHLRRNAAGTRVSAPAAASMTGSRSGDAFQPHGCAGVFGPCHYASCPVTMMRCSLGQLALNRQHAIICLSLSAWRCKAARWALSRSGPGFGRIVRNG